MKSLIVARCLGFRIASAQIRFISKSRSSFTDKDFAVFTLERRLIVEADEKLDKKSARDNSLEAWLRDRAFRQHSALFGQRPFLWHISDGLRDGFSVFVYYHRLEQATLRKLTYTMLGDWLARAKAEGNALRFEKGRELQQMLKKILEGEKPYDIFVRWKSLRELPIGWLPDLDDGVRMNIRPFVQAGVLRETVNINWSKDRGSDEPAAPWYSVFNGERINAHHTTLAEKQVAHEAAKTLVGATTPLDALITALHDAASYNSAAEAPPEAVVWCDANGDFLPLNGRLEKQTSLH
jgi:PAS domain-containing protein